MAVLPMVALVTAGFVGWGFTTCRKQRGIDRRHRDRIRRIQRRSRCSERYDSRIDSRRPHTRPSPEASGSLFIAGIIVTISFIVTVFAGLFRRGGQRIALLSFCVVLFLIFLSYFNAAGHFGTSQKSSSDHLGVGGK
jgi:hypothetical protein